MKRKHLLVLGALVTFTIIIIAISLTIDRVQPRYTPGASTVTTTPVPRTSAKISAWIYPGKPACSASQEYADGRVIDTLKPQYFTLGNDGTLTQVTVQSDGCNGYTPANAADVKAHSSHQFATISGSITGIATLSVNTALLSTAQQMLLTFLRTTGFTGIEFDVEDFGSWTQVQYNDYKSVLSTVGAALHGAGYQLMVDGPAISNATEQGYFPLWHYEDFNALPVDYIVVMAYDNQYDTGAGHAVQPLAWLKNICAWMTSKITDTNKIVIGIPSYGYHGKSGAYVVVRDTYEQSTQYPGFSTATRDPGSGEMMWSNGGTSYDYSDTTTLDGKLQAVLDAGIAQVSVWHLGGNQWFSAGGDTPPITPPVTPQDATSAFQDLVESAYPGFTDWYQAHFANGTYHA